MFALGPGLLDPLLMRTVLNLGHSCVNLRAQIAQLATSLQKRVRVRLEGRVLLQE